jgi:hypothetical protein
VDITPVAGGDPPNAPSNLVATVASATQISLSWTDNSNNEDGFRIERKTEPSGTWSEIATVSANVTTYQNSGLTTGTTYCYRVRAYNSYGNSSYSNEACATPTDDWITNISATSGRTYTAVYDALAIGQNIYTDRSLTFASVPSAYAGKTYIRTANDDKQSSGSSFLSFHVNQACTIYVGHDTRVSPLPSWLTSWTNTGTSLTASDNVTYTMYSKDFSAGNVTLGGNGGQHGDTSMYTVVLIPGSPPPPPPPSDMLTNGGFDTGSLSPWSTNGTFTVTTSGPQAGSHCVQHQSPDNNDTRIFQNNLELTGGVTYTLTAWYRVDQAAQGDSWRNAHIGFYPNSGPGWGNQLSHATLRRDVTGQWEQVTRQYTPSSNTTVSVGFIAYRTEATYKLDSFTVTAQ